MKTLLLAIIFLTVLGHSVAARPRTTETLRLGINKEKILPKSKLRIRFASLIEDSRCPIDTRCVWAGNAKISVRISKNGNSKTVELNTNVRDNAVTVEGYSIKLIRLTPEPRSNVRINRNGYQATLEVEKLTSSGHFGRASDFGRSER
jgi:hypothetical protein